MPFQNLNNRWFLKTSSPFEFVVEFLYATTITRPITLSIT